MSKHQVVLDSFVGDPEVVESFHTKAAALKYIRENSKPDAFSELRLKTKIPRRRAFGVKHAHSKSR